VAIAAINPVIADMVFVAEWNRLVTHNIHIRDERSRVDFIGRPYSSTHQQQRGHDADSRQAVRAAVKDLCHTQPNPSLRLSSAYMVLMRRCWLMPDNRDENTAAETLSAPTRTKFEDFMGWPPVG